MLKQIVMFLAHIGACEFITVNPVRTNFVGALWLPKLK